MKKLWDLKKLFSNLEPEGQGRGIIMGMTCLILLGLFYTIQTKHFDRECSWYVVPKWPLGCFSILFLFLIWNHCLPPLPPFFMYNKLSAAVVIIHFEFCYCNTRKIDCQLKIVGVSIKTISLLIQLETLQHYSWAYISSIVPKVRCEVFY